jgi:putative Mg2+ transporter-C (MgtC) family protein
MIIGVNRDLNAKPAGVRTLSLVALGAALVALAALHDNELVANQDALSRVIQGILQGVLTGVGFIGGGVILKLPQEEHVRGLTTAASVWITAVLGVTCALASWWLILSGLLMTLGVLTVAKPLARFMGFAPDNDGS